MLQTHHLRCSRQLLSNYFNTRTLRAYYQYDRSSYEGATAIIATNYHKNERGKSSTQVRLPAHILAVSWLRLYTSLSHYNARITPVTTTDRWRTCHRETADVIQMGVVLWAPAGLHFQRMFIEYVSCTEYMIALSQRDRQRHSTFATSTLEPHGGTGNPWTEFWNFNLMWLFVLDCAQHGQTGVWRRDRQTDRQT